LLAFRVITSVLSVFISPLVLIASLFRPKMKTGRTWLVSALVLTAFMAGAAWSAALWLDSAVADSLRVLGDYSTARVTVKGLPFAETLNTESLRNGVDPSLVAAFVQQVSGFEPATVSWRGARGLMQVMPAVWVEFMPAVACKGDHPAPACSESCIFAPAANIRVGTAYLRYLIDECGGDILSALTAYNSGMSSGTAISEGYARNVVSAWANLRAENTQERVNSSLIALKVRSVLSWAVIGMLCLIILWTLIRFPGLRRDDDGASDHRGNGSVGYRPRHRRAARMGRRASKAEPELEPESEFEPELEPESESTTRARAQASAGAGARAGARGAWTGAGKGDL
jgi:hypothetical protein